MQKVGTDNYYDYYVGCVGKIERRCIYNIVPMGSTAPTSGYFSIDYISRIKNSRFPLWYYPIWTNLSDDEKIAEALLYNRPDIARKYT